jgi:phage/plasmid-associated DNA primase
MAEERFATHRDSHVIYVYRGGVYQPWGEEAIREAYRRKLGELAREGHMDEVVEAVRERTFRDPEFFNSPPPNLVCVENGILDILTGELRPHDPDMVFLAKVPVRYDPEARCPRILRFLEEVYPNPQDALVLLEFGGYCLYRRHDFQQALMPVGEGETGKSTLGWPSTAGGVPRLALRNPEREVLHPRALGRPAGARGGLGGKGRPLRPLRGRFAEVGGRRGYHLTATDCL